MKTIAFALALALSLVGPASFDDAAAAPPQPGGNSLTLRITSATPGREVAVEGFYLFVQGQPQRVDGRTPLEFSSSTKYVSALIRSSDELNRIQVELVRGGARSDPVLLAGRGRVVRLSTAEAGEQPYEINAF